MVRWNGVSRGMIAGVCVVMGACSTPRTDSPAPGGAAFCAVATPIYWSRTDTRQTKEQIDTLNRLGVSLCGWKGKETKR